MSAKKLTLIILAGAALMFCSNNTFAMPDRHRDYHRDYRGDYRRDYHRGIVIFPPLVRPVFICPPHRTFIRTTVVVAPYYTTTTANIVQEQTVTVWITNDNGSKSSVPLIKEQNGPGFTGPKGEYYSGMPTEDQLKLLYGIGSKATKNAGFTVWITNDNGSKTPVTLTSSEAGFVGPSGEYYPNMPTEEQLKALYGLQSRTPTEDSVIIWLQNDGGAKTPVVLTKDGSEYIGPKGEHYQTIPTTEQLKMVYSEKPRKIKSDSTTIWLTNKDGSRTPITLQKEGSGFIGPAGEKYSSLPAEEQLKLLYSSDVAGNEQNELSFAITKKDGTQTTVVLKKEGSEFVGPKGERYPAMPTEEQLGMIYGK